MREGSKKESEIEIKIKNDNPKIRIIKDDEDQTVYLKFINYRQIHHIYFIFDDITDLVHKQLADENKSYSGIGDIILGIASLVFFIFLFYKFQIT